MAKTAGRQIELGIGVETTPGTGVAAADYIKWESLSFVAMSDKAMLNSARGIRNKTSNNIVVKQYGKGQIEFAPTTDILPYFLGLALGSRSSGTASGESAVYNHTFTVQNANASMKTATLTVKQGGIQTEQYTNSVVDSIDFTVNKDIAKCKVSLLGQFPTIVTAISPSYTLDSLFTRNQMLAYFGTSVSGALGTAASTIAITKIANIIQSKIFRILFNKHFIIVNYTFKSSESKHIIVVNLWRTELSCEIRF